MNSIADTTQIVKDRISSDFSSALENRGIQAAAAEMGWVANGKGWGYPIPGSKGNPVRWKAFDSAANPKYRWRGKPQDARYYHHANLKSAIAAADGIIHIVNGEPAVLTMLSAGLDNALCWFGEMNVPGTLAADLSDFGATQVVFYADNDSAGKGAAQKVINTLGKSGLRVDIRSLGLLSPGADVNDLWMDCGFDRAEFIHRLQSLPELDLAPTGKPRKTDWDSDYDANDEFIAEVVRATIAASPTEYPKRNGDNILIRNPFRDDKKPSFSINTKSGLANDFGGKGYNVWQLAELLGIERPRQRQPIISKSRRPRLRQVMPEHQHGLLHAPGQRGNGLDFVTSIDRQDYEWMTDALVNIPAGYPVSAFAAPKGMGKTVAMKTMAAEHRRRGRSMLHISFLTENVRHAAKVMDLDLYSELYIRLDNGQYENRSDQSPHIATTLNSLHKLARADGEIGKRDVILIDELNEVVDALVGKLLNKRETLTFRLFCDAIRMADFVIVSGADIRPLDLEFIYAIRGNAIHLIDPEKPKALPDSVQFADRQRLIETALNEAAKGLVVMPVDSKSTADSIARLAQSKGITKTLIVDANRANTAAVRAFLKDPTKEAPQYNLILFTTKISSGVSINAEANVRAVFGLFGNAQIGAETASQMIHRVRHAKRYGWYCHLSEAGPPRGDWRGYRNDWITNLVNNGFEADDVLESLAEVAAKGRHWLANSRYQKADRLRQLELYQGHRRVLFDDRKPDHDMTDDLKSIVQDVQDDKKYRVLNAESISPKELRGLAAAAQDMPEHHDGKLRWDIEDVTRRDISPELYDRFKSPTARMGLVNGRNQMTATDKLREMDEAEQRYKKPIHRRGNYVQRQAVARDLMRVLTGIDDFDKAVDWMTDRKHYIPAPILESKMKDWWPANESKVRRLFDIDHRSSDKPSAIIKLILRRVGLDIEGKRKPIGKKSIYRAFVDKGLLLEESAVKPKDVWHYGISAEIAVQWRADIAGQDAENADTSAPALSPEPANVHENVKPSAKRASWQGETDGSFVMDDPTAYIPGSDAEIDSIPF